MASKPKLKPCPFCGGEAQLLRISKLPNGVEEWFVSCGAASCDLYPHSTIPYASAEIAAAAWNRRAVGTPSNDAAMREALAEDRKRSKYERLHECFWDRQAVQCVIRQMLDERDDLSSIDPVSANRMEYFANLLIGAARDGKSFGNAAAMREALLKAIILLKACEWPDDAPMQDITEVMEEIEKALAAPPRNCDRFRDWDSAEAEYERLVQEGKAEDGTWCEWLFSVGQYASAQEGSAK